MTINYKLSAENRYEIRFPYNLKQHFKTTFKSAKWDPEGKCWHIGGSTANLNKLKAWTKGVEEIGINNFTTESIARPRFGTIARPKYGPYRYAPPDDMDIPVWDDEQKCWYDAEI
ncbi:TPA: hypothetical protein R9Y59_000173 [Stenotrophomonas maltophilia]|nr:hypothetical protein [Stenotrophomonas maltophilia]HEF1870143.1 hypothetical protein [Stenotrophomonas maltophilia]HEF1890513.1 hypothetical protein [Stenotrophomonas maltophilia]